MYSDLVMFHARKRTKKTTPKPGRPKKAKKDQVDEGSSVHSSPRTRLAAAREAVDRAAKEAQLALDKAAVAREAAAAAEAAAARDAAAAVAPLETIYHSPGSPHTPTRYNFQSTLTILQNIDEAILKGLHDHRNTSLELVVVNQQPPIEGADIRKMTPRRKLLCTKIKKTPTKGKKTAGTKGKKK